MAGMGKSDIAKAKRQIEALSEKTVARGCTPGEAAAAALKIAELQQKYELADNEILTLAKKAASKRTRAKKRKSADDGLEWFQERQWCTQLLFEHEAFGPVIADPACGSGQIPDIIRDAGYRTIATDIVDRGYSHFEGQLDYLNDPWPFGECDVVCNPPYARGLLAVAFVEQALANGANKIAVLVNESFLYSAGKWSKKEKRYIGGRHDCFERWPVSALYHLSSRPSMPPGGKGIKAKGGQTNYLWIVLTKGHEGPPLTYFLRLPNGISRADDRIPAQLWRPIKHLPGPPGKLDSELDANKCSATIDWITAITRDQV